MTSYPKHTPDDRIAKCPRCGRMITVSAEGLLARHAPTRFGSDVCRGSRRPPYPKHTPHSLSWRIVAVIDDEMQRLAYVCLDQSGPARESTARRVCELMALRRQAIRGSVR